MSKSMIFRSYSWFNQFVKFYYTSDPLVAKNIRLKEAHTYRVCQNMINLSDSININDHLRPLAEITALFHDVGRFPQFYTYKTFSDLKSVNHAQLSIDTINKYNVLSPLDKMDQELILKAIQYHNCIDIPKDNTDEILLVSRLIRDADKLDIFKIVTEYLETGFKDNPALEFKDASSYSATLAEAVLNNERINYRDVVTNYDRKLLELSWICDLNFKYSFIIFNKNNYLEKLISALPDDKTIKKVHKHLSDYIQNKLV